VFFVTRVAGIDQSYMMHGHDINLHADEGEQAKVEGEEMSSKVSVILG